MFGAFLIFKGGNIKDARNTNTQRNTYLQSLTFQQGVLVPFFLARKHDKHLHTTHVLR